MSEHGLKSAYHDMLTLETQTFSSADRPWRTWEGCRFYGDILRLAREHVEKNNVTCELTMKKDGKTMTKKKPPCLACPSEHTRKFDYCPPEFMGQGSPSVSVRPRVGALTFWTHTGSGTTL